MVDAEYHRAWYAKNKTKVAQTKKRWREREENIERHRANGRAAAKRAYDADPEKLRSKTRAWRDANPDKAKLSSRRWQLKRFGVTPEQWDAIFKAQGERCAICHTSDPHDNRGWHTDHDHTTGKMRGILCRNCNFALGQIRDNPMIARAMADYLDMHGRR
jgi:hypothetical protein